MKVIVSKIQEEGEVLSATENADMVGFSQDEIEGEIDVTASIHRAGESLFFEGTIRTTIRLQCSRCLKEFLLPTDIQFSGIGEPLPESQGEDEELSRGDIDVHYYQGDVLEFNDIFHEQIVLSFPMRPLCDEGCKGLCPRCGRDLNEGPCMCKETSTDPRWTSLKRFTDR
ncbi:MAG: DUF177 domain-containing protein [Nitrospirae bacterium]|nr:DUF177 domain-containing protein [Nitrospirota bacterium]